MDADGWTYVTVGDLEARYRRDSEEHAAPFARFEVEYFRRGEWGPVRNWNSRAWFTAGFHAGMEKREAQAELDLGVSHG